MKAMILAAGLGTRLRPLTNDRPKALVPVDGVPLLEIVIRRLIHFGIREVVVNIHHFGDQIIDFIQRNDSFGIRVDISDERDQLLDTGGAILKARPLLKDSTYFLVCNTDILSDIDLRAMEKFHLQSDAIATLAIRKRETSRYLLFDKKKSLIGWKNIKTGEYKWSRKEHFKEEENAYGFSGIHILNREIFDCFPKEKAFSIIPVYLDIAKTQSIKGYLHQNDEWLDVGKKDALAPAIELKRRLENRLDKKK